ncbi:hypothetical protein FOA52_013692 [Chlamydomonas sp. UWO 241]|nr:hypothetical protein FOA52_013692 [Chlamydomonas sp. UWO 241]
MSSEKETAVSLREGNAPTILTILLPKGKQLECILSATAYATPFCNPPRLCVQLSTCDERLGPNYAELSVNLPDQPALPPRQFYVKTWSENEGLLEQVVQQGAVHVVNALGVPVNAWGKCAAVAELAWPDSNMDVNIPEEGARRRNAADTERFLSNTFTMHLGM